jgi:heme O synthase-like polyprenyltransferase
LSFSHLFAQGPPSTTPMVFYNALFMLFAVLVCAVSYRYLPRYAWVYSAVALAVPLSYPAEGNPLMSVPRLLLEAFPLFWGVGVLLVRWPAWARRLYFAASLALGALFVALFATAHWVA